MAWVAVIEHAARVDALYAELLGDKGAFGASHARAVLWRAEVDRINARLAERGVAPVWGQGAPQPAPRVFTPARGVQYVSARVLSRDPILVSGLIRQLEDSRVAVKVEVGAPEDTPPDVEAAIVLDFAEGSRAIARLTKEEDGDAVAVVEGVSPDAAGGEQSWGMGVVCKGAGVAVVAGVVVAVLAHTGYDAGYIMLTFEKVRTLFALGLAWAGAGGKRAWDYFSARPPPPRRIAQPAEPVAEPVVSFGPRGATLRDFIDENGCLTDASGPHFEGDVCLRAGSWWDFAVAPNRALRNVAADTVTDFGTGDAPTGAGRGLRLDPPPLSTAVPSVRISNQLLADDLDLRMRVAAAFGLAPGKDPENFVYGGRTSFLAFNDAVDRLYELYPRDENGETVIPLVREGIANHFAASASAAPSAGAGAHEQARAAIARVAAEFPTTIVVSVDERSAEFALSVDASGALMWEPQ